MKKMNKTVLGALVATTLFSASGFTFFYQATTYNYYKTSAKLIKVGEQVNGCSRSGGYLDGQRTQFRTIIYGEPCVVRTDGPGTSDPSEP